MTMRLRALIRSVVIATVATAGLTMGAVPAAAHSNLIDSNPADGDVLPALPPKVVLTFSDDVQPDYTEVAVQYDGATIESADPVTDGAVVRQALEPLRARTATADVTISFRIISADGHDVDGTFTFTVDSTLAVEPTDQPTSAVTGTDPADVPTDTAPEVNSATPPATDDTSQASSGDSASDDDSTSGISTGTLVAIGAVVAAVIVVAGFELRRRIRRGRSDNDPMEGPTTR